MTYRVVALAAVVLALGCGVASGAPATRPASGPSTRAVESSEVAELREQVRILISENAELRRKLVELSRPPAAADEDRIKVAIRQHRITLGMTEAQIRQSMGEDTIFPWEHRDTEQTGADGNPEQVRYIRFGSNRWGNFEVWLRDGRVVRVEH